MENSIFCLEIKANKTNININNYFDNKNNIIELENQSYNLNENQFKEIIKQTEKNLLDLIKIAKEQTPNYLNENTVDGFGSNLFISMGGLNIKINKAAVFGKSGKLVSDFINQIINIIK